MNIGALLASGDYVSLTQGHFQALVQSDGGELKACHKLTSMHADLPDQAKMNVRIAAQTLSHTTAAAMVFNNPKLKPQAEVIQLINDVSILLINFMIFSINIKNLITNFLVVRCSQLFNEIQQVPYWLWIWGSPRSTKCSPSQDGSLC